eukprot:2284550-Amphidinium_carterae.1
MDQGFSSPNIQKCLHLEDRFLPEGEASTPPKHACGQHIDILVLVFRSALFNSSPLCVETLASSSSPTQFCKIVVA